MITLDPRTTALVLIDLQAGIVPHARGPRSGDEVVAAATSLADRFREIGAPVILSHVGFGLEDKPSQKVDRPGLPAGSTSLAYSELVPGLRKAGDIIIHKHQWGAFTGTDLDLQLRRRGVRTVVIGGIATNMGVESTARFAWELSYDVVIAEDATAASSAQMHAFAVENIFPQIARVVRSADIAFERPRLG